MIQEYKNILKSGTIRHSSTYSGQCLSFVGYSCNFCHSGCSVAQKALILLRSIRTHNLLFSGIVLVEESPGGECLAVRCVFIHVLTFITWEMFCVPKLLPFPPYRFLTTKIKCRSCTPLLFVDSRAQNGLTSPYHYIF